MGRFVTIVLFVIVAIAACATDEPTTEQRCQQVRDKLIDLRLANATGVDIKSHRAAMKTALGDGFVESCKTNLTVVQQQCVLKARDSATATACSGTRQ